MTAGLIPWTPFGFVVHGLGHMYAGSWMKGVSLFFIEGASIYLLAKTYNDYENGRYNYLTQNNNNGTNALTDLGPVEQGVGIALVATTGFVYTWWDDMGGAPIAARQFNAIHAQDAPVSLNVVPQPGGAMLALSRNF